MKIPDNLKKKLITLPNILIVLMMCAILMQQCTISHLRNQIPDGPPTTVVVHDTLTLSDTIYKPGSTITNDTTIYVPVPVDVDTAEILKDYFAKNIFTDTIKFKNNVGYASVRDTIQKNRILNRVWSYDVKQITTIITNEVPVYVPEKKRIQVYTGFGTGWNTTDLLSSVAGSVALKTKNDVIYQLQLGVSNDATTISPFVGVGMLWKIRLK